MQEINKQAAHFLFLLDGEIDYEIGRLKRILYQKFKVLSWTINNNDPDTINHNEVC